MNPTTQSQASHASSAQSLQAVGTQVFMQLQDKIKDICVAAQLHGKTDLSMREIQSQYELQHGKRIEMSTVSSRVNSLVAAGRLVRLGVPRPCAITGRNILPLVAPLTQARLVA